MWNSPTFAPIDFDLGLAATGGGGGARSLFIWLTDDVDDLTDDFGLVATGGGAAIFFIPPLGGGETLFALAFGFLATGGGADV